MPDLGFGILELNLRLVGLERVLYLFVELTVEAMGVIMRTLLERTEVKEAKKEP